MSSSVLPGYAVLKIGVVEGRLNSTEVCGEEKRLRRGRREGDHGRKFVARKLYLA